MSKPKFCIGQQIHHRIYDYYGIVLGVDPEFRSSDEWYDHMTAKYPASKRPSKEKPWYHVKVHQDGGLRYVAECNLELDHRGLN